MPGLQEGAPGRPSTLSVDSSRAWWPVHPREAQPSARRGWFTLVWCLHPRSARRRLVCSTEDPSWKSSTVSAGSSISILHVRGHVKLPPGLSHSIGCATRVQSTWLMKGVELVETYESDLNVANSESTGTSTAA